jgi:HD-like signal output (HDOD) protein
VSRADELLARHEQVPARAAAAARVLQLVDDPQTSAADLGRAIGTDPYFAAKLLRIANSTYYGLSGRVAALPFAVSVVGFQAVRSLAVVAASGLDSAAGAPEGFWGVAALCATGSELVAPVLGADPGDAFCVGLLHLLGTGLLHQDTTQVSLCLPEPPDPQVELELELERHGATHDVLAAQVLSAWHFPVHLCDVIREHHQPVLPDASPLRRTLQIARSLAEMVLREDLELALPGVDIAWLSEGRLQPSEVPALLTRMGERSKVLAEALTA